MSSTQLYLMGYNRLQMYVRLKRKTKNLHQYDILQKKVKEAIYVSIDAFIVLK